MKMEKRHTYLGWPLPGTESRWKAVKISWIHWGGHLYSCLYSCWYFSKQLPKTNSQSTRPVNLNCIKDQNQLHTALNHFCVTSEQQQTALAKSAASFTGQRWTCPLSPPKSSENKTARAGCLAGTAAWRISYLYLHTLRY